MSRAKDDWTKRADKFLGEIDGDVSLPDADYVDVMEEIASLAESRANAKKEEMKREAS